MMKFLVLGSILVGSVVAAAPSAQACDLITTVLSDYECNAYAAAYGYPRWIRQGVICYGCYNTADAGTSAEDPLKMNASFESSSQEEKAPKDEKTHQTVKSDTSAENI